MISYIKARLGEHATQLAISTDFGSLIAVLSGQIGWGAFVTVLIGSMPAILMPAGTISIGLGSVSGAGQ